MARKRTFISFDFDHDEDLRNLLVGQAKNPDTPFEITDYSVRDAMTGNWEQQVRERIRRTELVIVICGVHMFSATGVNVELRIAREENKPYFLLRGRPDRVCAKPSAALPTDMLYIWSWDNLKTLIGGGR